MSDWRAVERELRMGALGAPAGSVVSTWESARHPNVLCVRLRAPSGHSVDVMFTRALLSMPSSGLYVRREMEEACRQLNERAGRPRDPWGVARVQALEYVRRERWRDLTVGFGMVW